MSIIEKYLVHLQQLNSNQVPPKPTPSPPFNSFTEKPKLSSDDPEPTTIPIPITPIRIQTSSSSSSYSPPEYRYTPPPHNSRIYGSPIEIMSPSPFRDIQEREIFMGGLVSRPTSPDGAEKGSIEFPGIVLTEADPYSHSHPFRSSSTKTKSIMLLPPTSLPFPDPSDPIHSTSSSSAKSRSSFFNSRNTAVIGLRALMMLGVMVLGALHVWSVLGEAEDS